MSLVKIKACNAVNCWCDRKKGSLVLDFAFFSILGRHMYMYRYMFSVQIYTKCIADPFFYLDSCFCVAKVKKKKKKKHNFIKLQIKNLSK